MINKSFTISKPQEKFLKTRAKELDISETEVVRKLLDKEMERIQNDKDKVA